MPQPKSKAKARARSREMMNEGVEQTPDVSPPRLQPERPPIALLLAQKCEYHGKIDRRVLGSLRRNDDFLFYMESVAPFFCAEKFCMALCARMTRTYCCFWKKSSTVLFFSL